MSKKVIISAHNLTKKFGDFTAVNEVNFTVYRGEVFGFLGPNGAGKSTVIKMLTTLLKPTTGSIELDGHDVAGEPDAVRKSFGIVFQDPSLDDELTAYENMELHAVLYDVPALTLKARVAELLDLVELTDRQNSQVKTFSGGMKRRLELARGLLHSPHVLFLDEPTLGLDAQTRNLMWNYVQNLSDTKEMTIFFTTHYIEEAEMVADRIAFIDHGQIVAIGTPDELMHQTKTKTLEKAYLKLTGTAIRDTTVGASDQFKNRMRARH